MAHQQDGGPVTRVESYQWPTGHVAHLTQNQQNALEAFKKLCEKKGYYAPASADSQTHASHDDETLLRYLRARKFIPQEAFAQFKDTEDWRNENELDTLYETIDIEEYENTRRVYPQWTGRRDKRGIPLYVYEVNHIDAKDVSAHNNAKEVKHAKQSVKSKTPRKMLRLFALYENLCRFVLPLCSAIPDREHAETPISQSNNIVDISKVSFAKFWSLRNHMSDASTLATAHYPETLDRIFVVGAPGFFNTVWEWAKRWFDPITVSKIFILNDKNILSTLEKYVDRENIPKKYGGTLDWSFGNMPFLEPGIAENLRWKIDVHENGHRTLPKGPIRWQYDENGDLVATAIGSEHGKPRNSVIAGLHPQAGVATLALSPGRDMSIILHREASRQEASPSTPTPTRPPTARQMTGGIATTAATTKINDANMNAGKPSESMSQDFGSTGAHTVPYRDTANGHSYPPPDSRQGTSSTRFEQQQGTHAEDQLAAGTPDQRRDGGGEKVGVMEPSTVGQAVKEHPVHNPEEDAQQPDYVEQAQHLAGQAVEQAKALPHTVMAAVGLGGKEAAGEEEEEVAGREVKADPAVDGMDGKIVEEFLRSKTMSSVK
ncbi:hypothetical protein LTR91_004060 [Friedmanniomyces endolithicus]|uniref:CRAL-TRIO domain-containing protein n=1 Tax=Friedmanniomyces endolithicus TaxID=329885 RepID=A0AAN6KWH8_9PEZI|nr:hypothetical protein LTR94_000619 [Friedmanniomyces endolithicus]KAK0788270.1 hypothetical protein LTR59_010091 [Friedmanniomyces endolithicus]KAK0815619.1 hypothetical protein LTR38_002265 [Friedmanniomyces endolithicus]KAK0857546.1 hypothetical protein LTR03_000579 [Friedmanniomyces endolithicus]KAK0863709.1 hypothetical protein LTS02_006457 [Friedmanniomyces endolithicus]